MIIVETVNNAADIAESEPWLGDPRVQAIQANPEAPEAQLAWQSIHAEFKPQMTLTVESVCGRISDVEDIVQTAFISAVTALDRFEDGNPEALSKWLRTIARNRAKNHLRHTKVIHMMPWDTTDMDHRPDFISRSHDPFETVATQETLRETTETLRARLPQRQFTAFMLDAAGFSYEESSEITGDTRTAVKSLVHRARVKFEDINGKDASSS
jgi:RNA polymerase sigma factor (sigma-70 family)